MKYQPPYGVNDANASYVDGNPALGVEGSAVPAKAIEHPMRELAHLIAKAGLTPDEAKLTQVYEAVQKLITQAIPDVPERYELCEFYSFRHPVLRPGFQPAQGGVLANAAAQYPEAWAYLKTTDGQMLCKAESEWQAMTRATWATLADGTKVGWDGIGGAPFFVMDTANGTLRLPDLRGMYAEAAGFDALGVGGVHGDMARDWTGNFAAINYHLFQSVTGIYVATGGGNAVPTGSTYGVGYSNIQTILSRVTPTGSVNQPRAWGALACCYLGAPR